MKLTILGCSGSMGAPGNPASGYLVVPDGDTPPVVMDLGPGTLAVLQEHANPAEAHVALSHLHADHCLDFPGLLVWRRFHPTAPSSQIHQCWGPAHTPVHLGRLSSDDPQGVDDMSDTLDFQPFVHEKQVAFGDILITPYRVDHPVETYAMRVEEKGNTRSLCYSADSAFTDNLITAAHGVDYFFCEACWGPSNDGSAPGMHMSGDEAGRTARLAGVKTLVLVHLQPWTDREATLESARTEFDGPIILGAAGDTYEL